MSGGEGSDISNIMQKQEAIVEHILSHVENGSAKKD